MIAGTAKRNRGGQTCQHQEGFGGLARGSYSCKQTPELGQAVLPSHHRGIHHFCFHVTNIIIYNVITTLY